MPYFDGTTATSNDVTSYLPADVRSSQNLAFVASEAEADVINHYTVDLREVDQGYSSLRPPGGFQRRPYYHLAENEGVFLEHFKEDPAQVVDATASELVQKAQQKFLVAMKRTIAGVIVWRLAQLKRNTAANVTSVKDQGYTQWAPGHAEPFPTNWDRHLRNYDTREPSWSV